MWRVSSPRRIKALGPSPIKTGKGSEPTEEVDEKKHEAAGEPEAKQENESDGEESTQPVA